MNVHFGKRSHDRISQIDERLQRVVYKAATTMPFDLTVTEGLRTKEDQAKYVAAGTSWTMNSKHLIGKAIDIAPYPVDWGDYERFRVMAEHMFAAAKELGIRIKWGGTWAETTEGWLRNKKYDGPHFELVD